MPDSYGLTHDPFIALSWAASTTRDLLLGTGICLVAQHDPIILAKTVSSLDHMSKGRVRFAVGGGWNRPEMENHGVEFSERWSVVEEHLGAMKKIWCERPASFQGEKVRFDSLVSGPKPFQEPHPPILLGATGEDALKRVVNFCDGWIPIASEVEDLGQALERLKELSKEVGRDYYKLAISVFAAPRKAAELQRFASLGVKRAIFMVPPGKPDEVLKELDELAELTASAKGIID